jgi:uncharacterized protein YfdQ (DUF2303 family)
MDRDKVVSAPTETGAALIAAEDFGRTTARLEAVIAQLDNGRPYRIASNGAIEIVERLCAGPVWRRGAVTFYEALSFARFVNRFKNETTVVFADALARTFTAILDYHPGGEEQSAAQWDLFRATLPLKHTPSWATWAAANKKPMDQAEFAQFLEDQIPDIATPAGATLVEIARTLEAKTDVQFESHIRADNGAHRFQYLENVSANSAGTSGRIDIPQDFTLVLQPFEGSKTYAVQARFRYRISSKKLTMWFDLVRLQDVLTEAFNDELLKIQTEIGGTSPIYNGPAPDPQVPPKSANGQE